MVAVRIFADGEDAKPFRWGEHDLVPNAWHQIDAPAPAAMSDEAQASVFFRK